MISKKHRTLLTMASLVFALFLGQASAVAQFGTGLTQVEFNGTSAGPPLLTASGVIVPPNGDQPAILVIQALLEPDLYTYSITQPRGGPVPTKLKLDKSEKFVVGEFLPIEEPKSAIEPLFDNLLVEKHMGGAVWYAPLLLANGVTIDDLQIKGKIYAQICDPTNCFPPRDFAFVATLGKSPVTLPKVEPLAPSKISSPKPPESPNNPSNASNSKSENPTTDSTPSAITETPSGVQSLGNTSDSSPGHGLNDPLVTESRSLEYDLEQLVPQSKAMSSDASLLLMIGAALLAGLILNFMPCVLPVIGLKLLSFLEQGGGNPRRVLALNLWYSLGIISVFWVLAGIAVAVQAGLGKTFGINEFGWGQQFRYDGFNIALVSIVFVMALSFLGVWEIPIPGFAGNRNAKGLAQKEGAIGAFAKGVITTVLATPCSGPFLGTAVGFALKSPPYVTITIFTIMGIGMAAPYILVAFRPSLMRFLPKPGPWMDTFKQLMGFALIATVLWLMLPIDAPLLRPTLVLLAGLAAACWWIGRTPVYAELIDKLRAWGLATIFTVIVGWFAFAMPQINDPLPWRDFTMAKFVGDVNSGKTVLVEFTADWCATCKALKAANLDRSKTKAAIEQNKVVVYEVDIDHISDEERDFFMRMQPSQGIPLIAIFPAGKKYQPISFGDGYTQSQILQALKEAGASQSSN